MTKARATKAEISRAIEATRDCGLAVCGIEVGADGTIRVMTAEAVASPPRIAEPSGPKKWRT